MNRRHFIKLSAATSAALLFGRLTYATGNTRLMNLPDEVWVLLSSGWHRLLPDGYDHFAGMGVGVSLHAKNNYCRVQITSGTHPVKLVSLKWRHAANPASKCLGDSWERTYGDAQWSAIDASAAKKPWYVLVNDGHKTACFGVKTGCNTLCWWTLTDSHMELVMDMHCGGNALPLHSRILHAADIITTESLLGENAFAAARRFCSLMCEKPRLPKQPVYGINDWYYAYGNNSAELINKLTGMMTGLAMDAGNRPFSVVDAGWAQYSPYLPNDGGWADDFSKPNDKFKDMHRMAEDIKAQHMRPGLWTRPLCAHYNERENLLLPKIKGREDLHNPVLDPSIPENLERVKYNISTYKAWGYELVKHDYTTYDITGRWGFQMTDSITEPGWAFNDGSKTTAEIIKTLYQSIRDAAGDMYIIGCNTISHLSAGVFELQRIGDDTSGKDWARTRKMGVNAMGFRMQQHNTFYAADGDCVGLTTNIPWEKNKQWMQLLAESSAPLFISPQPEALGEAQKVFIKDCFAKAAQPQPIGEPLDWMENPLPAKWNLDNREVDFDWG